MKHIKLFEEFSTINEAQETLRKELKKIHKSNTEGMSEESAAEHIEELEKSHSDKSKEIKKFFSLMSDLEAATKEASGNEDDEKAEELNGKVEGLNSKISELITNLG
jgi:polyhydroxyalkanoate synthesis regulator protein